MSACGFAVVALLAGGACAVLLLGYLLWLGVGPPREAVGPPPPAEWPGVDVIVPVHDESRWLRAKLENLGELRYPASHLKVWIVDGASSDGTAEVAEAWVRGDPRFELLRLPVADKTAQLNAALARGAGAWVLVTDADACLGPDTLRMLVAAGEAHPELAVLGTPVAPAGAHPLEQLHWQVTNHLRGRESHRGSSSFVAGPCYLFRRSLLAAFPRDVVADDVYVALVAVARGQRVAFVPAAVSDLRSPTRLVDLFRHKLRKADAYLREIVRFLPELGAMPAAARPLLLWRAAQMTVMPVLAVTTLVGVVGWLVTSAVAAVTLGMLAAAWLTVAAVFGRRSGQMVLRGLALGALLTAVLLVTLVGYLRSPWQRPDRGWYPRPSVRT